MLWRKVLARLWFVHRVEHRETKHQPEQGDKASYKFPVTLVAPPNDFLAPHVRLQNRYDSDRDEEAAEKSTHVSPIIHVILQNRELPKKTKRYSCLHSKIQ